MKKARYTLVLLVIFIISLTSYSFAKNQTNIKVTEQFIKYIREESFFKVNNLFEKNTEIDLVEILKPAWDKIKKNYGHMIKYSIDKELSIDKDIYVKILFEKGTLFAIFQFNKDHRLMSIRFRENISKKYILENRGKFFVTIPEILELTNIIIAITQKNLKEPYLVNDKTDYYKDVLKRFEKYKDNPAVEKIQFSKEMLSDYIRFRASSFFYHFDKKGRIDKYIDYPHIDSGFQKNLKLIEEFAKKSNYISFYTDNQKYYNKLIEDYKSIIPVKKIWKWLEGNFSSRYDTYYIVISPLINGIHNTIRFYNKGSKECIMFVGAIDDTSIDKIEEALFTRAIFTEIDHNYVNPTTNMFKQEVDNALGDFKKWNKQKYDNYDSSYLTFNEYVTWGTFLLFAYDSYEKSVFKEVKKKVVSQMVKQRKFIHFDKFADFYINLYIKEGDNSKIEDLYPTIIKWFKGYK